MIRERLLRPRPTLIICCFLTGIMTLLGHEPAAATGYEGFGSTTPGGSGGEVVTVTTLADSGPGSLREALSTGNRTVVFAVAGEILLLGHLYVKAFVTIDGFSAPPPGITLRGYGLVISGKRGAHDVIVRGLRIRDPAIDGIQVSYGAYNVVIDHVSVGGAGDGDIDITESAHDVTVSWSILAEPISGKTMLIKYNPAWITLHHNLFVRGLTRNPNVAMGTGLPASDTTVDMRNNVIWDWGVGWGTVIHDGAWANVVNNYYASPGSTPGDQQDALIVCRGECANGPTDIGFAYIFGNVSGDLVDIDINAVGNEALAFPAPPVTTTDACTAAQQVVAEAGVRPLDAIDQAYLAAVTLPGCDAGPDLDPDPDPATVDLALESMVVPKTASAGALVDVFNRVTNVGAGAMANARVAFYLSRDRTIDTGDAFLGARLLGLLASGQTAATTTSLLIPAGIAAGNHTLIAIVELADGVIDLTSGNNIASAPIKIVVPDLVVASVSAPSSAAAATAITISDVTENRGDGDAGVSETVYSLRDRNGVETFLGTRTLPLLPGKARHAGSALVTLPTVAAGSYTIVAYADGSGLVEEKRESNNARTRSITIK